MDDHRNGKTIKEKVLEAIASGRAKMRPRWQFVLRAVLLATGAVLLLLLLVYLVSFTVFTLRVTGVWFAPLFGSRGWLTFVRSLPWLLVILSAVFVVVLEVLVRRYSFAYRKPLLYSVLGIVLIVTVGGFAIVPWHRDFFRSARENRLPFAGPFYRDFGLRRFGDVHRGTIVSVTLEGFVMMKDAERGTSTVVIAPGARIPSVPGFAAGDPVVVFGDERGDGRIEAYGVRRLNAEDDIFVGPAPFGATAPPFALPPREIPGRGGR
jgi:hypothetical protein